MALRFITSVFGDRHVSMLIPLLFSIERSNPGAAISVYWEDISPKKKDLIRSAYPEVEFVDTHFDFTQDVTRRISSKTLVWEQAAKDKQGEPGWRFFMDADMLVLRPIETFLKPLSADVVYTYRAGQFWINSGILATQEHPSLPAFFTLWRVRTQAILNDSNLFAQANNKTLHYGGADQMSLQELLAYRLENNDYTLPIAAGTLHFRGVECTYLNETDSRPITEATHIIHYKGGWRDILFFGGPFTPNRPKEASWAMYQLYLRTFQSAVERLNQKLNTHFRVQDFGLVLPWYLNRKTLEERPFRYPAYVFQKKVTTFIPRLRVFAQERWLNRG